MLILDTVLMTENACWENLHSFSFELYLWAKVLVLNEDNLNVFSSDFTSY